MFKILALFLLALSSTNAFWTACTDRAGAIAPNRVESASCSGSLCTVVRGETLVADAFATFTSAHSVLTVRVTAYILGIGVNLPQDPPYDNACNSIFINGVMTGCPTTPNVESLWRIQMLVPTTYPAFQNTRVRYELLENNNVVACANIQATLT
ncbi:unnamed protein product [Chironomus riparius]|uniref:MD-2-related lipid-recognition domain-containing protein n=1 Tax=Chironomus riparius TaxID=315576 RepID=A0A9N9S506_9DIPT|nr:unnamed protein product [Chironomus riparius]